MQKISLRQKTLQLLFVRVSSLVNYLGLPVGKTAFPADIAAKLDSMAVGQTSGVIEDKLVQHTECYPIDFKTTIT